MGYLVQEIRNEVYDMAQSRVEQEIREGMPYEYAYLMERRVYSNYISELKKML